MSVSVVPEPSSKLYAATSPGLAFETATLTGEDVVVLPAASRATAVIECAPLETVVESHEML